MNHNDIEIFRAEQCVEQRDCHIDDIPDAALESQQRPTAFCHLRREKLARDKESEGDHGGRNRRKQPGARDLLQIHAGESGENHRRVADVH